jgi:hypothetical protein
MSPREKEVQEQRRQQDLMEVQFAHIRDLNKQLAKKGQSSVRALPGFQGFSDVETAGTTSSNAQDYNAYSLDRALTNKKNRYKKSAETKPRHKVLLKGMDAYTQNLSMPNTIDTSDEAPQPNEHLNEYLNGSGKENLLDKTDTNKKASRVSVISVGETEDTLPSEPKVEVLNATTASTSRSSTIVSTADTALPGNEVSAVSTVPVTFSELLPNPTTQLLPQTTPPSQSSVPPATSHPTVLNSVPRLYPGPGSTQLNRSSSILDSSSSIAMISPTPFRASSAQPVIRAVKAPQMMTPASRPTSPQPNAGSDGMIGTSPQPSSPALTTPHFNGGMLLLLVLNQIKTYSYISNDCL